MKHVYEQVSTETVETLDTNTSTLSDGSLQIVVSNPDTGIFGVGGDHLSALLDYKQAVQDFKDVADG